MPAGVDRLAVDREAGMAGDDDVELLVAALRPSLLVLLDDVLPGAGAA